MSALRGAAVLALVLALVGCATYRTQRLGVIAPWPPRGAGPAADSVELRIYGNLRDEGGALELEAGQLALWREQARRAYRESGLFRDIAEGWNTGGVIAEIGFVVRSSALQSQDAIVRALPFQRNELIARTRFLDREGRELGAIELSEAVRFYSARALLPFLTTSNSGRVVRQVVYDLQRATLSRAVEQGILPVAQPQQ